MLPAQMEDLRNIIGQGRSEDGSRWYVVSGRDPRTGKIWRRAGWKVTISPNTYCRRCDERHCGHLDTLHELENMLEPGLIEAIKEQLPWLEFDVESYSCSCDDFRETQEECIHILSVEHFEEELTTRKERVIPQKLEEIESLRRKIEELEVEKDSRDEDVQILRLELEDKEAESQAAAQIMAENERLAQEYEKVRRLSERRFAPLYDLPKDIQSHILSLKRFEPEQIREILGPAIYEGIPRSERSHKDKISLSKREHHRPRQFWEFAERIARIDTIDLITDSWLESAKDTRIKRIYPPEQDLPNGQRNSCWTIHVVYSGGDFSANLYLQTTARSEGEAELIAKYGVGNKI